VRGNIPPPADQVHIDLGALDERVRGTERAIDDVNGRLDNLGTQINNMSSSFAQQMTRISEKIDAKMQVKPTNWLAFVTAAAAIVALGITIGSLVMVPAFSSIRENAADIKERVTTKEFDEFGRNMHSRDEKLSQLIEGLTRDKIGIREHDEFKDNIEGRIGALEKTQDNRLLDFDKSIGDRLSAIISRLDAISSRVNETQDRPK
jgi:tetrahydromethanopterin S-methyltransferase subunit G